MINLEQQKHLEHLERLTEVLPKSIEHFTSYMKIFDQVFKEFKEMAPLYAKLLAIKDPTPDQQENIHYMTLAQSIMLDAMAPMLTISVYHHQSFKAVLEARNTIAKYNDKLFK